MSFSSARIEFSLAVAARDLRHVRASLDYALIVLLDVLLQILQELCVLVIHLSVADGVTLAVEVLSLTFSRSVFV